MKFTISAVALFLVSLVIDSLAFAQTIPTPEDILQKFQSAIGGEEAIRSFANVKISFEECLYVESDGKSQTTTSTSTVYSAGQKWLIVSSLGTESGFDGERYWTRSASGKTQWSDLRYPFQNMDPIFYPLHILNFPGKLFYGGTQSFDETRVHILKTELAHPEPDGRTQMAPLEFYFGAENGLLVRVVHEHKTVDFGKYEDVNGCMVAHELVSSTSLDDLKSKSTCKITGVEMDVDIDDDIFSPENCP